MFCENCGNPLKDTDKFCSSCGRPVPQTEEVPPQMAEENGIPEESMIEGNIDENNMEENTTTEETVNAAPENTMYFDSVPPQMAGEKPYKKHTTAIAVVLGVIGVCVVIALYAAVTIMGQRVKQRLKQDYNNSSYYGENYGDDSEDDSSDDNSDFFDGRDFNFGSDSDDGGDLGDFF